jgi:hypothetical protein
VTIDSHIKNPKVLDVESGTLTKVSCEERFWVQSRHREVGERQKLRPLSLTVSKVAFGQFLYVQCA